MVGRFEAVGHATALRVAAHALRRRSLEDALQVTGLAIHLGVRAGQREAGAQVIEARTALRGRLGGQGQHEQAQQAAQGGSEDRNESAVVFHIRPSCGDAIGKLG